MRDRVDRRGRRGQPVVMVMGSVCQNHTRGRAEKNHGIQKVDLDATGTPLVRTGRKVWISLRRSSKRPYRNELI